MLAQRADADCFNGLWGMTESLKRFYARFAMTTMVCISFQDKQLKQSPTGANQWVKGT